MKFDLLVKRVFTIFKYAGLWNLLSFCFIYLLNNAHLQWLNIRWFFFIRRVKSNPIITTLFNTQMKIHLRDRGISRELAILHVHEPHSTKFITEFIEEGTVICDIGANIGYYALLESALTGPKGKVIAIEPISENVELLNANLKLNDIQNVTVVQAAISDTDGKSKLFLSKSSNLPSLFKIHSWKPSLGIREITSYKLDTLLNKMSLPVDFIRMDLEGGEVIALKGMGQVLERYKPRLMIETHTQFVGKQKIVAMFNNLRNYGYDIKSVIDRDRDFPWHKSNHGTRELNIDALVTDKYTVEAERIFTVFLF